MRTALAAFALLAAAAIGVDVKAQLRVGGAPLEKSWGPVKSSYQDARTGETFLVFEAANGTVRIARVNRANAQRADCVSGCVDVVAELRRE